MAIVDATAAVSSGQDRRSGKFLQTLRNIADADLSEALFFQQLGEECLRASGAQGLVIWESRAGRPLRTLSTHGRFDDLAIRNETEAAHGSLLEHGFTTTSCQVVAPNCRAAHSSCINPLKQTLLLAPVPFDFALEPRRYVLELFYRGYLDAAEETDQLTLARQAVDATLGFLKNSELRQFQRRHKIGQLLDQFTEAVHGSLRVKEVCYVLANEGRRLIGCDRVSVALPERRRWRVCAVSGQDTLDPRARIIRLLNDLVATVVRTGKPLWYSGTTGDLPPQIEIALEEYVEESHARLVGIVPLAVPTEEGQPEPRSIGALVVEQIEALEDERALQTRTDVLLRPAVQALDNARRHEQLFLLPLWRAIGESRVLFQARTLPKTVLAAVVTAVLIAVLVFIPYKFEVFAPGTLQPVLRRKVFAPVDGVVDQVLVRHGEHVQPDQPLIQMRNTDLEVEITDLTGQLAAAREQLTAVERTLVENGKRLPADERNRLSGQRSELGQQLRGLTDQLTLQKQKRTSLRLLSPLAGDVVTWNLDEELHQRPVRMGQSLVEIADAASDWELELRVPEDQMGYVAQAQHDLGAALAVQYRLATDPAVDYAGTVKDVHLAAEIHGEEENTVLVRVRINKQDLSHVQPGSECRAKLYCGERSCGYVLLHDLVGFMQSRILFRIW